MFAAMNARTVLLAIVAAAVPATASARPHARTKYTPKISLESARKVALDEVHGKVIAQELEHERGRWIYSFEIRPDGQVASRKKHRTIREINVSADDGTIVSREIERDPGTKPLP